MDIVLWPAKLHRKADSEVFLQISLSWFLGFGCKQNDQLDPQTTKQKINLTKPKPVHEWSILTISIANFIPQKKPIKILLFVVERFSSYIRIYFITFSQQKRTEMAHVYGKLIYGGWNDLDNIQKYYLIEGDLKIMIY